MAKRRVRLIHRKPEEVAAQIRRLETAGYRVDAGPIRNAADLRRLRERPPDAAVIDVSRAFAHGRDIGLALRQFKQTRRVPLVFVEADRVKTARLRNVLPDSVSCPWTRLRSTLSRAIANPPLNPKKPTSLLAGYSGTPLLKKLGITDDMVVVLAQAPDGFERTLGTLPSGVTLRRQNRGTRDVTLWFTRSRKALDDGIRRVVSAVGDGRLWIVWPKRASPLAGDHTETDVRSVGLEAGLVDYKICAVDADWSGLQFVRRRAQS